MASPEEIQDDVDVALGKYEASGDADALFEELRSVIVPDGVEWTFSPALSEVRLKFLRACPQEAQSMFVKELLYSYDEVVEWVYRHVPDLVDDKTKSEHVLAELQTAASYLRNAHDDVKQCFYHNFEPEEAPFFRDYYDRMKRHVSLILDDSFSADYVRTKLSGELKDVDVFDAKDRCLVLMNALPLPSDDDAVSAVDYRDRLREVWASIERLQPAVEKAVAYVEAHGLGGGGAPAAASGLARSFSHVIL